MNRAVLVITIDTESDHQGVKAWIKSDPLKFSSVLDGIPNRLQPVFNKFGAKPTYLVSSEVLENDRCIEVLSSLKGDYELGTHLHGEYINPKKKYEDFDGTVSGEFACFYDEGLEYEKIRNLTELFKRKFGIKPKSYRAGCFAADGGTIHILERLGYKVDTSVTPHCRWSNKYGMGMLDFLMAPEQPYIPDPSWITKAGHSGILEVPISVSRPFLRTGLVYRLLTKTNISSKLTNTFLPAVWLRPSFSSSRQMLKLIKKFCRKYRQNRYVVLNMMLHSMEVMPNLSPYTRNEEDCKKFLVRIDKVLNFCSRSGTQFMKLADLYDLYVNATPE